MCTGAHTQLLAGIMKEKRPDNLKMNTIEFLLQNMNGWLRKKTQEEFMSAGEIISKKMSMRN